MARVRMALKDSRWQRLKRGCKWNGWQMALVRASVVGDVLSVAVNRPDLAPVLLPPNSRSPQPAGCGSVPTHTVLLPSAGGF